MKSEATADINIIGVDTGAMSGVAIFQWVGATRHFTSIELPFQGTVTYVRRWLNERSGWIVAVERYTPSQKVMSPQLDALETIGALRFIVGDSARFDHRFVLQPRAEAKKIGGVRVLKQLGWHKITKDGHADDAARHVLLALLQHYPLDYEHLMSEIQ